MSLSSAFIPAIPISGRTSLFSTHRQRRVTKFTSRRPTRTRAVTTMTTPPLEQLTRIAILLASKGDIGPFTNVDVESVGLAAAIAGGSLIAAFIAVVITRF